MEFPGGVLYASVTYLKAETEPTNPNIESLTPITDEELEDGLREDYEGEDSIDQMYYMVKYDTIDKQVER